MIPARALLVRRHLRAARLAVEQLDGQSDRLLRWAAALVETFERGGRLLVAGNGGSAAQAQHLTAELVGRYQEDRAPFSALALHTDTSSLTALANDYGQREMYARQVRGHGRPGDILMLLSTSGESLNLLAAVDAARSLGMTTWALTGPGDSRLAAACDDALCITAPSTAAVQESHLVAVHLLCGLFDDSLRETGSGSLREAGSSSLRAPTSSSLREAGAGHARTRRVAAR